jgi:hypothetical protein
VRPTDEQIAEWFEAPLTEYFFSLVTKLKDSARESLADQGFDAESAERLMAMRGNLWGMHTAFETIEQVFEDKSFSQIEEQESAEHVGNISTGGSGSHQAG